MNWGFKLKKSQILIFGSFLIFIGLGILVLGHFNVLKEEVYERVRLSFIDKDSDEKKEEVTDAGNVSNVGSNDTVSNATVDNGSEVPRKKPVHYDYIGFLEIPKVRIKRGFLNKDSKYNDIQYNVMVSYDADFPDVENGNFILVAHSGTSYISFFERLYKLDLGDLAYVTYGGVKYTYKLVKVEVQPKVGVIAIHRPNYNVKGLTLITCTHDSDETQSIYIFEMV